MLPRTVKLFYINAADNRMHGTLSHIVEYLMDFLHLFLSFGRYALAFCFGVMFAFQVKFIVVDR